ncbi:MAG: ribonuclease HII [Candidatus Woesearchaeota archaeon]
MLICGIDEAGRGPVIGPMVISGFMCEEYLLDKLTRLEIKDSKKILPNKREKIFEKLIKLDSKFFIIKISPKEIDDALESATINLNWLEAINTAKIINKLKPKKAYIDCPSSNCLNYKNYLLNLLDDKNIELIIEHKADDKYMVSGAASILAKVTRDREIVKLKEIHGDFGSGYPSDPKTIEFIKENYNLPIFRKSWNTWKKANKSQKQLSYF